MRASVGIMLLLAAGALPVGAVQAQAAQCVALATPKALPIRPTVVAPIAPELVAPSHQLGAPTGVLSQAFDEALAVDQVLFRLRLENCQIAKALPAAPSALPSSSDPAAYKPKTQYDNTPWRFDMNQNGKRMTAEEFDAWMKAKGVRVVRARPAVAPPPPEAPKPEADKK
ncbi:MAG TPA: hypothetical protein VGD42_22710 [Lysobacter sp.]